MLHISYIGWFVFYKWSCYSKQLKRGAINVDRLEGILSVLDYALNTKKKRHIAGGILMSVSMLFGGLALTILTVKIDEEEYEQVYIE